MALTFVEFNFEIPRDRKHEQRVPASRRPGTKAKQRRNSADFVNYIFCSTSVCHFDT